MNQKILKFDYPLITSYPTHANMFTVLNNNVQSNVWFYNYYIQLFARKNRPEEGYVDFYAPKPWITCPFIHYQRFDRSFVKIKWNSIIDFLIDAVDNDYYAFLYLNGFYIPRYWSYNSLNFMHDTLVFGYDKLKEEIFTADFYGVETKYSTNQVPFENIQSAYETLDLTHNIDLLEGIILLKPKHNVQYEIDLGLIKRFLNDYISCKTSTFGYSEGYRFDVHLSKDDFVFGLEVYNVLLSYLEILKDPQKPKFIRGIYVLKDYCVLMLMRLEFLNQCGCILNFNNIFNCRIQILNKIKLLLSTLLKSFLANDTRLINKAIDLINDIRLMDEENINEIIQNIK